MNQKERLVELCDNVITSCKSSLCDDCEHNNIDYPNCMSVRFADKILADGWFRPPCKVGDVVYFVPRNSGKPIGTIDEVEIVMIGNTESGFCAKGKIGENTFDVYPHFEIDNYTFYTSREEAEKVLRGGDVECI